jgi:hypothetical protein
MATKELSREDKLIKKLKDDGSIVLKSRYGKTQGPLVICPVIDPITGEMKGVKPASEDDKKKQARVVDENTSRKIFDGIELRYESIVDRTDWEWMVHNKEIATSREESWKDELSLYFVDDYVAEQKKKVSDRELRLDAQLKVKQLSADRRNEVARLFGVPANQLEPAEVSEFLYDKAEKFPQLVLDRIGDENTGEKLFAMDAIQANLIKQDHATNIYLYGDLKIGTSLESVIAWVKDEENRDLVREIQLLLDK